jgi:hypothetical protein
MKLILTSLIFNLIKSGYINEADEITEILKDLEDGEQNMLATSNGLEGDVKSQHPIGGLTVEPFFFEKSTT